jgi:hypothetical protein
MSEVQEETEVVERAVFRVQLTDISATWELVKGYFAPVFAEAKTHTPEDVRLILLRQGAQLWVQWNLGTQAIEAAFVTEMVIYPRGVWVRLWLGGAQPGAKVDYQAVRGAMTLFATQNGAMGFEITGRHGWLRKFPEAVVEGLMMRVTFDG